MSTSVHNTKYPSNGHHSWNEVPVLVRWRKREEVIGKDIIDGDARKIGVTKDLAWSEDGVFALIVEGADEEEFFLPFDNVEKVGDVIFVKAKASLLSIPMRTCPMCKHKNPIEAMFCAKCGRTLEEKNDAIEKRRNAQ
jgi:sporulation protein YlmC with PRC-barrel domain